MAHGITDLPVGHFCLCLIRHYGKWEAVVINTLSVPAESPRSHAETPFALLVSTATKLRLSSLHCLASDFSEIVGVDEGALVPQCAPGLNWSFEIESSQSAYRKKWSEIPHDREELWRF